MLSDHDREALRKIHRELSSEDPDFVQSFEADSLSSASPHGTGPYIALVWIWICVVASILALVSLTMRSPGSAMVFVTLAWYAGYRELRSPGNEQKRRPERR